jgi:PAS domain S-box-containing protein
MDRVKSGQPHPERSAEPEPRSEPSDDPPPRSEHEAHAGPRSGLAVEEREARLRALVEASPLGIVIMDLRGAPVFYNPKCEELHGIDLGEAGGSGWEKAVDPDDRERIVASWYAAARAGERWSDTYRFRHPDGRVVWVIGRAAPMYVAGEHVGFVGTLEDITDIKDAQRERERLLEQAQDGLEQAETAARLREQTLAAVAHELRNPLQTIGMSVEVLLAETSGAGDHSAHARQLAIMQRTVKRMERLIRDLLDMSRIEAGTLELRREPLLVTELIEETREAFERAAEEGEIRLDSDVSSETPQVCGDHERLAQVLGNLVDNAIKFTPRGGRIVVRAQPRGAEVRVSVEDSGPGVPADLQPHVFDFFWQAHRASRVGTGLGLAIAKDIIKAHGGDIWVESDGGAKFYFTLPCADRSS